MDKNIAAWMIAGGLQIDLPSTIRDREQLLAFRESQRLDRVSWIDRLRGITRSKTADVDLVCCAA
jgi:hypothetical protein